MTAVVAAVAVEFQEDGLPVLEHREESRQLAVVVLPDSGTDSALPRLQDEEVVLGAVMAGVMDDQVRET